MHAYFRKNLFKLYRPVFCYVNERLRIFTMICRDLCALCERCLQRSRRRTLRVDYNLYAAQGIADGAVACAPTAGASTPQKVAKGHLHLPSPRAKENAPRPVQGRGGVSKSPRPCDYSAPRNASR